jgi:predicted dehydrogenase
MNEASLCIGVVGAGSFAGFAVEQFLQLPGVTLAGVVDTRVEAAQAMAQRFGVEPVADLKTLVARPEVDLVYLATPPFLHFSQARQALEAGKHVISEKPLAVSLEQADQLVALARQQDRLCIANLMQRYNPLFDAVRGLVESRALGDVLHGYFENYAGDEGLSLEHWFWDRNQSGGIFIEHGVHFFDLFAGWLGSGQVVAAQRTRRPGSGIEEQVQCTVRYTEGVHVNFYHGFTQPARLDRQQFRLLFERGEITLEEWVPIRARIDALINEDTLRVVTALFPDARMEVKETYEAARQAVRGRHKDFTADRRVELFVGEGADKAERYRQLLRSMLEDQWAWIRDRSHRRRITEQNGRDSVAQAETATRLADQIETEILSPDRG